MNNSDFQKLLLTNDKELISELTKAPKKGKVQNKFKGKGVGKGATEKNKGRKGTGKGGANKDEEKVAAGPDYRDRAKERRELKGEYERVAAEWENHGEVTVEQSKYLGGDLNHTHLVKGLDYALLTKVRTELTKQKKAEEFQQVRALRKVQKKRTFQTELGRKVWNAVVETLHPHHATFKQRVEKMGKAISMGQRIRGALTVFLPGRMSYEFDIAMNQGRTDIPRIVYISKEDAPSVDGSTKVASVLPETVARLRDAFQRATEERRQRKREKTVGAEASYTVAQKIVSKHKARDVDTDIFQGAGGFDIMELVQRSKSSSQTTSRAPPTNGASNASYFDDAGSDQYRRAPEGQIDPKELEVEEREDANAQTLNSGSAAFDAADSFSGARAGWVFKLGPQGLGYYKDVSRAATTQIGAAASGAAGLETRRSSRKTVRSAAPTPADDDAYGECFPDAGLGHALVQTGGGDSDEEAAEEGKKKRALLGKKKDDVKGGDTLAANQKQSAAEAKKRKMSESQQWQKIDSMIRKGKHGSLEDLEAYASKPKRNQPPMPREIMGTPAYF